MRVYEFRKMVDQIDDSLRDYENPDVKVVIYKEGSIGATPSVSVTGIYLGFDWDTNQVLIHTAGRLCKFDK